MILRNPKTNERRILGGGNVNQQARSFLAEGWELIIDSLPPLVSYEQIEVLQAEIKRLRAEVERLKRKPKPRIAAKEK